MFKEAEVSHHTITFGSKRIPFSLSFSNRKSLGIKVYPDSTVQVAAPMDASHEKVKLKVKEKAPWILKQQYEFLSYYPLTPPRKYISGETHLYLGRQYKLKIVSGKENNVSLYRGKLLLTLKNNASAKQILNDWYRQKAAILFEEAVKKILPRFKKYNLSQPVIQIRTMPTRWGSCTAKGKIILNPDLAKASKGCIEYVIIHELCHLVHHNHTKAFYTLQEKTMPDWRKWKDRLETTLN